MNAILRFCSAFIILLGGVCCAEGQNQSDWGGFFIQMDSASYSDLENTISERAQQCSWGNPNNEQVIPMDKRAQLYRAVAEGNEFAFKAGLLIMRCLDGGELEDFHRNAGAFFEAKPIVFLREIKDRSISGRYFKFMLTALPMGTVDNVDLAINVVERRIGIIESVNNDSLEQFKGVGLSFLEKELAMLVGIQGRLNNEN